MPQMSNHSKVVEDISQKAIIANRRKLRENMLKQIGQRTAIAEKNIKELARMTS